MSRAQDLYDRLVFGGHEEVLAFIAQSVTEELFLDYKRSADNGAGTALHNKDRANLAKAISGFGNSEGGVIIWGVDCRNDPSAGDIPTGPIPIHNPSRFKSWLEQATTGLTVPPHAGVRHHVVPEGFALTLIPSGIHAPYQTVGDLSYYIRAGSSFAKTPHAVLSGLFGRRPQPSVKHHYFVSKLPVLMPDKSVTTQIDVILRNYGRGIAEDIFANLSVRTHPGKGCEINFLPSEEKETWTGRFVRNQQIQMITRPGIRLAPEADLMPISMNIVLRRPFEREFSFEGACGCAGGEPWRFDFNADFRDIASAYQIFAGAHPDSDAEVAAANFSALFFKSLKAN